MVALWKSPQRLVTPFPHPQRWAESKDTEKEGGGGLGDRGSGWLVGGEQAGPQRGGKREEGQCVCYPICVSVERSHVQMLSRCRKPVSDLGPSTG